MSTNEYELLKIETVVLKVHLNCQGCMKKVKKVLRKIEGVYRVGIKTEEKVIVTCRVNPATLVQKLAKFGKHAEIWSADYNQEQPNHVRDKNKNRPQYVINDSNASENQYMIPTFFGRDHWGPEWCLNQDTGVRAVESEINQHLAAPLFLEDVNNINDQSFTRINENPKWEDSMIPMMRPASFQENSCTNYSSLVSQEWTWNLLEASPISEYGHQPSHMSSIHGYYDDYHPSKMMQLYYYNHLPWGTNIHMQEMPTRNDALMNAHRHQEMTNLVFSSWPINSDSY